MNFDEIVKSIKLAKAAAFRYQKDGHSRYRDRITVYCDAKVLFERFCYGEAAGLVFKMWGECKADKIDWKYDLCAHSQKNEAPIKLDVANNSVAFDDSPIIWNKTQELKNDAQNGYSFFKMLFER